jgi:hypothetical protein
LKTIFFLTVLILLSCSKTQEEIDKENKKPNIAMAQVMCNSKMESKLISPASAKFAGPFDGIQAEFLSYSESTKENLYQLVSYVDSTNALGVEIRTKFYCKISNKIGTDSWEVFVLDLRP